MDLDGIGRSGEFNSKAKELSERFGLVGPNKYTTTADVCGYEVNLPAFGSNDMNVNLCGYAWCSTILRSAHYLPLSG